MLRQYHPKPFAPLQAPLSRIEKETDLRRTNVRNGAIEVLKLDPERTAAAERSLKTLLRQGRELRKQAGSPQLLSSDTLSEADAKYAISGFRQSVADDLALG